MTKTIKPYGSVNTEEVHYVIETKKGFFLKDRYGYWQIEEKTYLDLLKQGVKRL